MSGPGARPSLNRSFRHTLGWAGALIVVALTAMAVAMAIGLADANQLLYRLSASQDQLAAVTRIQADISGLIADAALNGRSDRELASLATGIEAQLRVYRFSIPAEGRRLGSADDVAHQDAEARNAEVLTVLFSRLDADLAAEDSSSRTAAKARLAADHGRFDSLAHEIVAGERQEAAQAMAAMRRLRLRLTWLGFGILVLGGLGGAGAAWLMLDGVVRPLRLLEGAAERAGRGETPSPVEVRGFAEFEQFARAFNRMDAQIAAQRQALSDANAGLEAQVQARTGEIEASRRKLAEVDQTRRLFFSKLSHELRTPATVIRGEAEVALRDAAAPAPRLREALEHVAANGAFLQRRLEDMLALARAEDGRVALQRGPVDLAALARAVVLLAEPYVRSSGMVLEAQVPEGPGPSIEGDASWLQQALLALIDNAAKFAVGGQVIRLDLAAAEGYASIVVEDDGPGVAAADLPSIFESYYQAQPGGVRAGSGLGLSIARWVVEQHGGQIAAESPPEHGLVIRIRLPIFA